MEDLPSGLADPYHPTISARLKVPAQFASASTSYYWGRSAPSPEKGVSLV